MDSTELLQQLQSPQVYPHPVRYFKVLETHISWVILTGEYAYKIKKPVDFGFLDYTQIEQRQYYCERELHCNQALAPDIYLEVVAVTKEDDGQIKINGQGSIIEYALKMREFSQKTILAQLADQGELSDAIITDIANQLAYFHNHTPAAPRQTPFGTLQEIEAPVNENFADILPFLSKDSDQHQLAQIEEWARQQAKNLATEFAWRKENKWIRACHGDVHLGNITLIEGKAVIFDAIEFNESLRWTDVMADTGFLMMDLLNRNLTQLAILFLNTYLSITGDYRGLAILPYYMSYRIMVRAKIQLLEQASPQINPEKKQQCWENYANYLKLATSLTQASTPILLITQGVSGSGKSTVAQTLSAALNAIWIRSDIERKRLFKAQNQTTQAAVNQGIYSPIHSQQTYTQLLSQARYALNAGYSVILDACYLKAEERNGAKELARTLNIPFVIIACSASDSQLKHRIEQRHQQENNVSDATTDVLSMQQTKLEPLTEDEAQYTIRLDTEKTIHDSALRDTIMTLVKANHG